MTQELNATIRILGIAGSLREDSFNQSALEAARKLAPAGAEIEIYALTEAIPLFNQDKEHNPPPAVVELREKILAADAILFATPEYNYSIPGVLKNAIDWASRPRGENAWAGKPAAVMGASASLMGTVRAQNHLRDVMVSLDMHPLNQPEVLISQAGERFDEQGNLTDETTAKLIRQLLENLVEWTRRLQAGEEVIAGKEGERVE